VGVGVVELELQVVVVAILMGEIILAVRGILEQVEVEVLVI
jgi:hypothetical protein